MAAHNGELEIVRELILAGADVNKVGDSDLGWTPLVTAVSHRHTDIVKLLIAANADVNCTTTNGKSPLLIATYSGRLEVVRILLAAGANPNA